MLDQKQFVPERDHRRCPIVMACIAHLGRVTLPDGQAKRNRTRGKQFVQMRDYLRCPILMTRIAHMGRVPLLDGPDKKNRT